MCVTNENTVLLAIKTRRLTSRARSIKFPASVARKSITVPCLIQGETKHKNPVSAKVSSYIPRNGRICGCRGVAHSLASLVMVLPSVRNGTFHARIPWKPSQIDVSWGPSKTWTSAGASVQHLASCNYRYTHWRTRLEQPGSAWLI
jgi:hypothetical protein